MARPGPPPDAATRAEFDELLATAVADGADQFLDYPLRAPKWQFLCHAADRGGFVLHGTGAAEIATFEPRQPADATEFGNRNGVYAAADGIWPMYFAILDRERHDMGLLNACIRPRGGPHSYYFFSISRSALAHQPWRDGVVYLLPADGFELQPPITIGGQQILIAQAVNTAPVRPVAKLRVEPGEFPFLQQIRGHDPEQVRVRAAADPAGFPWLDPATSAGPA